MNSQRTNAGRSINVPQAGAVTQAVHHAKLSIFAVYCIKCQPRYVCLSLALVWVLLGFSACTGPTPRAAPIVSPVPTELAPDFQLTTLRGQPITLHTLQGRWIIINFWATWCIPCRNEMPYLQTLADQHADQLTVLGVNMREKPTEIQSFVDEMQVHFPILMQPDDAMLLAYAVRKLPLTIVVDPDGRMIYHQFGPLQPKTFEPWLRDALAIH